MKQTLVGTTLLLGVLYWTSCSQNGTQAIDLETGETISVIEDSTTGKMIDVETGEPVELYVEKASGDTIYGLTGEVINNELTQTDDGRYAYYPHTSPSNIPSDRDEGEFTIKRDEDGEVKIKGDDYKKKIEPDGDVKIKQGDKKIKIDGETGEVKVKD